MLERLLGEDIEVAFEPNGSSLHVHADPGMIDQLLINLCVNARDAMPGGGTVTITTDKVVVEQPDHARSPNAVPGAYARVSVTDHGHGMDDATLARIFEPFFTTKPQGKGTGLGLATVHGIVKQHGGWVEVATAHGRGTTFDVYLPVATATVHTTTRREPAVMGAGELILVVEDEPSLLRAITATLRDRNFSVETAIDSTTALQKWARRKNEIQLLLTDMVMPGGMTGLELARQLRLDRPELPVVIFSGYSSDRLSDTTPDEHVTYIPKPCPADVLASTLVGRLAGRTS